MKTAGGMEVNTSASIIQHFTEKGKAQSLEEPENSGKHRKIPPQHRHLRLDKSTVLRYNNNVVKYRISKR